MAVNQVFTLLVVDDDPLIHQAIKMSLPPSWKCISVQDPVYIPWHQTFHAAFVDMHLGGDKKAEGLKVVELIAQKNSFTEIIAMSGDLTRKLMEEVLLKGAQKFLAKPLTMQEIQLHLRKIEALWLLRQQTFQTPMPLIGKSPAMEKLRQDIAQMKNEMSPILIEGETGSGKEVVARTLHAQEGSRPWIAVNVAAIPENIFESEMFGHVKGAFTGADQNKTGLIEAAHGGDLFLDEMEAFPMHLQVKLLRFLESKEIRRVGSQETKIVQARVLVASNIPLLELVKKGLFREDLYYRISEHRLNLPPLRDRMADIADLCSYFFTVDTNRAGKTLTHDGLAALKNYSWPGNIRELKRVCMRLQVFAPLPLVREADVQNVLPTTSNSIPTTEMRFDMSEGLQKCLESIECQLLQTELNKEPDIDALAAKLKVSRSNLYKKIKQYGLRED